jgi:hypothetical protein
MKISDPKIIPILRMSFALVMLIILIGQNMEFVIIGVEADQALGKPLCELQLVVLQEKLLNIK